MFVLCLSNCSCSAAKAWRIALGTICSQGLQATLLSNPDDVVSGCKFCSQHRNTN